MDSDMVLMAFSLCNSSELFFVKFFFHISVQTLYYIGIDSLNLFIINKMNEIVDVQFHHLLLFTSETTSAPCFL